MKVGDKYEIEYPFYNMSDQSMGIPIDFSWIVPGCHKGEEVYDNNWGGETTEVYWVANFEGKICYEILSIAKMPGRYMDRVIIKYHYIQPNGEVFSSSKIKTLTARKLKTQIKLNKVFPCDYEIDEDYK